MNKALGDFIPLTLAVAASILSNPAMGATKMSYAKTGAYNALTYTFQAQNTGDIVAYFTGASAAYDSRISILVNGVDTGVYGFDNHSSSIGQSIDLGSVKAGDKLVFVLSIVGSSQNQI